MSYDDVELLSKPKIDLGNVINNAQKTLKPTKGLRLKKGQRPKKYKSNPSSNRIFGDLEKYLERYYDARETETPSVSSSVTPIPDIDDPDEGYDNAF